MTPVVAVGAIVLDADGRVLLVQRGQPPGEGLWSVPGGKLEAGESIAAAVARETREETGLVVEVGELACVVERIGEGFHYVIVDHVARLARVSGAVCRGRDSLPAPGSDVRAARFVAWSELADLPLTAGLLPVLERARATHAAWFGFPSSSLRPTRPTRPI